MYIMAFELTLAAFYAYSLSTQPGMQLDNYAQTAVNK